MSTNETTMYLENVKDRFDQFREDENWDEIRKLGLELEDKGMREVDVTLMNLLTTDEVNSYRRWDREVNGDMETQMDDDSDQGPDGINPSAEVGQD